MFKKRVFSFLLAFVTMLTLFACGRAEEVVDEFTVTFYDKTGSVLKEESVPFLEDANPPQVPSVEGHTFVRWDGSYRRVTEDLDIYPLYDAVMRTVTFNSGTGYIYDVQTVAHGTGAIEPDEPVREGYTFTGWDKSFDHVTEDLVVNPVFEAITYTVMFKCETGLIHSTQTINHGSDATLPAAPTRVGHTFIGWNQSHVRITENRDIYSVYEINSFTVTFKNASGLIYNIQTVVYGEDAIPPEDPEKLGHAFSGWVGDYTNITEDTTIYSSYEIFTYTITFESNEGTPVSSLSNVPHGSTVTLETPSREGYIFLGWFMENSLHAQNFTSNRAVMHNMTLYAIWLEDDTDVYHQVTFIDDDESVLASYYVLDGQAASAPQSPTKEGHNFIGWDNAFDEITSDVTIQAQYEVQTFTVEFDTGTDDVLPPLEDVSYGSTITLPVIEKEDYVFIEWQLNGEPFTEESVVTEDSVLVAQWALETYTITFDTNEGDALDPMTVELYSTIEALPIPLRDGYRFDGWYLEETLITTPWIFNHKEDMTLRAEWISASIEGMVYMINDEQVTIYGYTGEATSLYIPDAIEGYPVTRIASGAFMNNATIEHLVIGRHVKTIEADAFKNMSALNSIVFTNELEIIFEGILNGSNALQEITLSAEAPYPLKYYFGTLDSHIPASLTSIILADGATFIDRTLLNNPVRNVSKLVIGEGITEIPSAMLRQHPTINEVILPSTLKHIGGYAFQYSRITSIHIPASVETIDAYAFAFTNFLTQVTFEEGGQLTSFSTSVFEESRVREIIIPANIQTIDTRAFAYTWELTNLSFEDGSQLETIGYAAFFQSNIRTIMIPSNVQYVKEWAFRATWRLTILTEEESAPTTWDDGWNPDNRLVVWGVTERVDNGEFVYATTKEDTAIVLGLSPFAGDTHLHIPESIDGKTFVHIVDWAFAYETRLLSVSIPSQITTIGRYAFSSTSALETVTLAENSQLTLIQEYAFSSSALTSFTIGEGSALTTIDQLAFAWSSNLASINLENATALETIGNQAFYQAGLTSLHLPASVVSIHNYAFAAMPSLTSVTFAENSQLTTIGSGALSSIGITTIIIPASVETIQSYGLAYNGNLTTINFEAGSQLHTINSFAFFRSGITSIYLSLEVTTIGLGAFRECNSLTIYTAHPSKPDGWHASWNDSNRPVVWDYTEE